MKQTVCTAVKIKSLGKIPVPPVFRMGNKYGLKDMTIGECIEIRDCNPKSVSVYVSHFKKKNPKYKFTTRVGVKSIRIWRLP